MRVYRQLILKPKKAEPHTNPEALLLNPQVAKALCRTPEEALWNPCRIMLP